MKRILSLFIVAVLAMGLLGVSALADGEPTIRVGSVEAAPGDTVTVEVSLENNPGIMAFVLGIEYDETRLEKVKFSHTGLQGLWALSENAVWVGNEDDDYEGLFLKLTFQVLEDAPAGEAAVSVTYDEGGICNYNEENVDFTVVSGGVTVSGNGGESAAEPEEEDAPEPTEAPRATEAPDDGGNSDINDSADSEAAAETAAFAEEDAISAPDEEPEEAPDVTEETETDAPEGEEDSHSVVEEVADAVVTAEYTAPVLEVAAGGSSRSMLLVGMLLLAAVALVLIVVIVSICLKNNSYRGKH